MRTQSQTFAASMRDGSWRIAALSAGLGLLLWAWFALTLTPVQRYYFSTYVSSSLHRVGSHEKDHAEWILKTKPKDKLEIADAADLVPATHGALPFALSNLALGQGWTGIDTTVPIAYPAGSQRLFLRQVFFDGRSLSDLLLPPLELMALPLAVWSAFIYWRRERDRQRSPSWVWAYGETSWYEDAGQFSCEMADASKYAAVTGWKWARSGYAAVKRWRERESVSPSAPAVSKPQKVQGKEPRPVAVATAITPDPKGQVRAAQPSAPQPIQGELDLIAEAPRVQTLPFRKRQAASPEAKWDESKWID